MSLIIMSYNTYYVFFFFLMTLGVDTDLIKVACYAGLSSHPIFVGPTYLKTGS